MAALDRPTAGRIVWIASYPKSGNTWVRAFLTNYLRGAPEPADINELDGLIASGRALFEEHAGVEPSDLTPAEIMKLRPKVYKHLSDAAEGVVFVKAHDAFSDNSDGPLFPPDATACAIYLIRNPLDVAPSFAAHMGVSLEVAVSCMCSNFAYSNSETQLGEQLEQHLLTWNAHVASWVDQRRIPVRVVRYEDLLENPTKSFGEIVAAVGLPLRNDGLSKAVEFSSFDSLKRQERKRGFRERPRHTQEFFRAGVSGAWKTLLSPDQVTRLIDANREVMQRFGYVTAQGLPT